MAYNSQRCKEERGHCRRSSWPVLLRFHLFPSSRALLTLAPVLFGAAAAAIAYSIPAALAPTPGSQPIPVATAMQLVAAIGDNTVRAVRLTTNIRVDPSAWSSRASDTYPLVRSTNFTIHGAEWFPILDLAFVESKVMLQPFVRFTFEQVELRNVRTRSGFDVDVFACSPNATVRYDHIVYYCFSCLPTNFLARAIMEIQPASLPNAVENMSWTRPQAALQETYSAPNHTLLFRSASSVLATTGLPGATSGGGGYELQALNTIFVCDDPIDPALCEAGRGVDHCISSKIEAMAQQDDTWERLAAVALTLPSPRQDNKTFRGTSVGGEGASNGAGGDGRAGGGGSVRIAAVVGGTISAAVVWGVTCVAVVLYILQRRRRHLNDVGTPAPASTAPAVISDSESPAPADYNMLAIRVTTEDGGTGGGKGGSCTRLLPVNSAGQKSSAANGLEKDVRTQEDAKPVTLTASAAVTTVVNEEAANVTMMSYGLQSRPPPHLADSMPYRHCIDGVVGGGDFHALAAVPAGVTTTLTTLGESLQELSSVASQSAAAEGSGVWPDVSCGAGWDGRHQPVVVVAGITIELMNVIGSGSFGKVFRGSWQGRPVAVKVLQYSAELSRAVHNEVLLSQTLRHPNVVSALYFAQVLPGCRLGLTTSGGPIATVRSPIHPQCSTATPQPAAIPAPDGAVAATAVAVPGVVGSYGSPGEAEAGCYSRFIVSGLPGDPSSLGPRVATAIAAAAAIDEGVVGGVGRTGLTCVVAREEDGGAGGEREGAGDDGQGLRREWEVVRTSRDKAAGEGGRSAAWPETITVPHFRLESAVTSSNSSSQTFPLSDETPLRHHHQPFTYDHHHHYRHHHQDQQQGRESREEELGLQKDEHQQHSDREGASGGRLCSSLLTSARSELDVEKVDVNLPGGESYSCNGGGGGGVVVYDFECSASGGDSGSVRRSCSEPDVLSRWDEQRRRQALVQQVGAIGLMGSELIVSSNGYLQRIGADGGGSGRPPTRTNTSPPRIISGATLAVREDTGTSMAAAKAAGREARLSTSCSKPSTKTADDAAAVAQRENGTACRDLPMAVDSAAVAGLPLEALWLAAHTHPVVGSSNGFLVMELCEGGSAFMWRRSAQWGGASSAGRPDLGILLRLALDIAYGMSHIHSMGICHGDLKLSNVLLTRSPDVMGPAHVQAGSSTNGPNDLLTGWVAKVGDFGLSRVLTGDRTHVSTRPYGTPTHMAPELWTKGHVSQPADVYAYGITLWELATGQRPYRGLNAACILHQVLLSGGRPGLAAGLPPSYTRLMTSCWAQAPKDRPTFGDIVRHLEAMLSVLAAVTPKTSELRAEWEEGGGCSPRPE